MNELELNEATAALLCQEMCWNGRSLRNGQCLALLDGAVVAIADDLDGALAALRKMEPDPRRGMVVEIAPPVVDVIRGNADRLFS